ncbi:hypothetical protein EVAR_86610_1 [Eumeta japonica]|uniref:Uncharacterized protein n=1 Tax=Eumeta variegata TaxID=151549 RepID=A0A4C1W3W3_EUMVA|nr:hypothetical protein EVAR_86610_1 [Eumeta japonica]
MTALNVAEILSPRIMSKKYEKNPFSVLAFMMSGGAKRRSACVSSYTSLPLPTTCKVCPAASPPSTCDGFFRLLCRPLYRPLSRCRFGSWSRVSSNSDHLLRPGSFIDSIPTKLYQRSPCTPTTETRALLLQSFLDIRKCDDALQQAELAKTSAAKVLSMMCPKKVDSARTVSIWMIRLRCQRESGVLYHTNIQVKQLGVDAAGKLRWPPY